MICYHHNDLDGRCSAAIVLKTHPECTMREIDYKDNPDFSEEVNPEEYVFIVDFSFKPGKLEELFAITHPAKVVWLDHHETAKDYKYKTPYSESILNLKGLRDFSTKCKKSGCELTWDYLFGSIAVPEAVRLVGDYDCWRFDTEEQTNLFQQGMRLIPTSPNSPVWKLLLAGGGVDRVIRDGLVATKYRDNFCASYRKSFGEEVEFEGYSCYTMNLSMMGSPGFGSEFNSHDIAISTVYQAGKWTVSMYSKEIHVGEIAKRYGGGGHKGAAGFVCTKLPWEVHTL